MSKSVNKSVYQNIYWRIVPCVAKKLEARFNIKSNAFSSSQLSHFLDTARL